MDKTEKESVCVREIHLLVHSSNAYNSRGWARLKPGSGNSIRCPTWVAGAPITWVVRNVDLGAGLGLKLRHSSMGSRSQVASSPLGKCMPQADCFSHLKMHEGHRKAWLKIANEA